MGSIGPSTRRGPALSRGIIGPVAADSRLIEVDVVRGVALFAVLLENMYGFGADSIAWSSATDRVAFGIMHVFFESKTWTLFSILFGFGFALQLGRAQENGVPILPVYLRRLARSSRTASDQQ